MWDVQKRVRPFFKRPHDGVLNESGCMRRVLWLMGLALALVTGNRQEVVADVIVNYQGSTIGYGSTGFVDVFVSSDADPLTPDILDSFSAHFLITPVGGAVVNGLQFTDPQSDSQLGHANYVFFGNSLLNSLSLPLGLVSTSTNANDTYIGGDATFDGLGVALDNTTSPYLLFRFGLDATLANIGDQFQMTLINDGSTSFQDTAPLPLALSSSSFNTFTITAVPEPATGGVLLAGTVAGLWLKRRRKLRPNNSPASK